MKPQTAELVNTFRNMYFPIWFTKPGQEWPCRGRGAARPEHQRMRRWSKEAGGSRRRRAATNLGRAMTPVCSLIYAYETQLLVGQCPSRTLIFKICIAKPGRDGLCAAGAMAN